MTNTRALNPREQATSKEEDHPEAQDTFDDRPASEFLNRRKEALFEETVWSQ